MDVLAFLEQEGACIVPMPLPVEHECVLALAEPERRAVTLEETGGWKRKFVSGRVFYEKRIDWKRQRRADFNRTNDAYTTCALARCGKAELK